LSFTSSKIEFKKRLYRYIVKVIKFVNLIPAGLTEDVIKKQVIRSSSSIGANYFESLAASSKRDFINYFTHALKSANETRFWLALLRDTAMIQAQQAPQMNELVVETKEIANIFGFQCFNNERKKK
jgi:four helix bundle protein